MAQKSNDGNYPYYNETITGYGNLAEDPKKISGSGKTTVTIVKVISNSMAIDRDGSEINRKKFREIKLFGKQADSALDNLSKGDFVRYSGPLVPKPAWKTKDGETVEDDLIQANDRDGIVITLFGMGGGSGSSKRSRDDDDRGRSRGRSRNRRDEDFDDYDDEFDDGDDFEEEEEAPRRSRGAGRSRNAGRSRSRSRSREDDVEDDYDDEPVDEIDIEEEEAPRRSRGAGRSRSRSKKAEVDTDDLDDYTSSVI